MYLYVFLRYCLLFLLKKERKFGQREKNKKYYKRKGKRIVYSFLPKKNYKHYILFSNSIIALLVVRLLVSSLSVSFTSSLPWSFLYKLVIYFTLYILTLAFFLVLFMLGSLNESFFSTSFFLSTNFIIGASGVFSWFNLPDFPLVLFGRRDPLINWTHKVFAAFLSVVLSSPSLMARC